MATLPAVTDAPAVLMQPKRGPAPAVCTAHGRPRTAVLMGIMLAAGIGERLLRYSQQFPIWGDEAYLSLNFLNQTHLGFLNGMKHNQVAPILFLWAELTVCHLLGYSELAMRLLPLLAGIAALILFWRLARRILDPVPALLAVGILAVSYYPIRHANEVKPYSFDLLVSIVLISMAAFWLENPHRLRWLAALCLSVGVLLGFSYPAVFVAGGVSLALLPAVYRLPWRTRALWLVYNVILVTAFAGYMEIGSRMNSAADEEIMNRCWAGAFPPAQPVAFASWFINTHTSNLMAYPIGGKNGGSTLTFLLFLAGAVTCWRQGRRDLLLVCLAPFAMTFLAACLERYPYGDSARVNQHLAPMICLLAGMGLASIITTATRAADTRKRCVFATCGVLLLFALACSIADSLRPYKTETDRRARFIASAIGKDAGPQTPLVMLCGREYLFPDMEWYLRINHGRVIQLDEANWSDLRSSETIAGLRFSHNTKPSNPPVLPDAQSQLTRTIVKQEIYSRPLDGFRDMTEYCEVFYWK